GSSRNACWFAFVIQFCVCCKRPPGAGLWAGVVPGLSVSRLAGKILARWHPQGTTEHGDEGAVAAVTQFQGDLRQGLSLSKSIQCLGQQQLLAPLAEIHAGFPFEQPCQVPDTGA